MAALALFLDFFLPASAAIIPVGLLLIVILAGVVIHRIHHWRDRD